MAVDLDCQLGIYTGLLNRYRSVGRSFEVNCGDWFHGVIGSVMRAVRINFRV